MRWLSLLVALPVFADVPAPRDVAECRRDADCLISSFDGCCGSCCPRARAWSRERLAAAERRCAVIDCAGPVCTNQPCPPEPGPQRAVCEQGQCVARPLADASDPDFCASDSDCVSSSFAGCCGSCCPVQPFAVTRRRAQLSVQRCATMRCAREACDDVGCAQVMPSPITPVCRANRCVAERAPIVVPPPAPECRVDSDCGVDLNPPTGSACWSSACGCCPTPRAVPVERVRPPPVRKTPSGQGTPFGLSQGNSGGAPSCGACAPVTPGSARCSAGRCALR